MERPALPRSDEVRELTATLVLHLDGLVRDAERCRDQLPRHSTDWCVLEGVIARSRDELGRGPGPGLCSAVLHMRELGLAARRLLECLGA
ncbi:hypothetical protein GCM10010218_33490 [Streptomyces mashuensis]|uniref:Uncharacterized protein n=1 Tax=Streptomyces mashuensis TaxID=33904 RepID=A0A919ECH2_9ACTN|nr:DUF6415 family natural product biosynthesis protein [Streptomyces mashuensis]GHF49501.1 hypothetical protein GCM10010218_33490 [Streptomyces mashuensis]